MVRVGLASESGREGREEVRGGPAEEDEKEVGEKYDASSV